MRKAWMTWLVLAMGALSIDAVAQEKQDLGGNVDVLKDLPLAERVKTAEGYVQQIQEVIDRGNQLLNDARAQEDVARMDCINEKLIAVKGFLNVGQNSNANLADAVARKDDASSQHHLKLSNMAAVRSSSLGSEMMACLGANLEYTGPTKLDAKRSCKIEPCLDGEELTTPSSDATTKPSADASPYL